MKIIYERLRAVAEEFISTLKTRLAMATINGKALTTLPPTSLAICVFYAVTIVAIKMGNQNKQEA